MAPSPTTSENITEHRQRTLSSASNKSLKKENGFLAKKPRKEILCDGWYYDVTDFIKRHPGGIVINYYTKPGEDATTAIQQFHHRSFSKVETIMKSFKRRPAEVGDNDKKTDMEGVKKNQALTEDFTKLYLELENEGWFQPSYSHIAYRITEILMLALIGYYCIVLSTSYTMWGIGCCVLGMAQARCFWLMHEGGHYSLTGKPKVDKLIQTIAVGVGCGLSAKWWNDAHNRHHAMPQRIKHDVDLATLPYLAYNKKVVDNPKEGQTFWIRNQKYLFLTIDTFIVFLTWQFQMNPKRMIKFRMYFEMLCLVVRYSLFTFVGFWPLFFSVWFMSIYLLLNFALSHTHLPVATEPTHWVEYGLTHTVNIEPRLWCDWWMCYLNYQIEHHLFPAMPQFKQKQIAPRIKAFAEKHGVPYRIMSYKEAVYATFNNLAEVAEELKNTS